MDKRGHNKKKLRQWFDEKCLKKSFNDSIFILNCGCYAIEAEN